MAIFQEEVDRYTYKVVSILLGKNCVKTWWFAFLLVAILCMAAILSMAAILASILKNISQRCSWSRADIVEKNVVSKHGNLIFYQQCFFACRPYWRPFWKINLMKMSVKLGRYCRKKLCQNTRISFFIIDDFWHGGHIGGHFEKKVHEDVRGVGQIL